MQIEAIVTCYGFADFLAETLPENLNQVDRIIVITHPDDKETIGLCHKYTVDCFPTTVWHEDGDKFNKGRAINVGLGHLRGWDWILHLDADILLPSRFKDLLNRSKLQQTKLYGADRINVFGYCHFAEHRHKLEPSLMSHYFVEPPKEFPLGARIIHHELGYCPIGYFQLWHKSVNKRYPVHAGNAEHTDVLFAAQWARWDRVLLPEVIVSHLDSATEPQQMGANWEGRKSAPFRCNCGHHHKHHKHHHHHPYECK